MEPIKVEKDESSVEPETKHPVGPSMEPPKESTPPQRRRVRRELCHGDTEEAIQDFVDRYNAVWDELHGPKPETTASSSPPLPLVFANRSVTRLFTGAISPRRRKYPRCISCGDPSCQDEIKEGPATQNTPNTGEGSRNEFIKLEEVRK